MVLDLIKKTLKFCQGNLSKVKLGSASLFPGNSCFITQHTGHGGWLQAAWEEAEEAIPSAAS